MQQQVNQENDLAITRHDLQNDHRLSFLHEIYVEQGTIDDWHSFKELHYKGEKLPVGPRFWRIMLRDRAIGVIIMSVPKMLLGGRNEIFKHLRPNVNGKDNRLINKSRAEWINANMCVNSRTVLDTMYRGCGIAYRALNIAMRMSQRSYIEFQSSMSKFNPFAEKAGIVFSQPRQATNYERGVKFFGRWFNCDPRDFVAVKQELESLPSFMRIKCMVEMRDFYYQFSSLEKSGNNRHNGTSRIDTLTDDKIIKNVQQLSFASPLYGVYKNPDVKQINPGESHPKSHLPDRIPIMAFDNQLTGQPLDLKAMEKVNASYT